MFQKRDYPKAAEVQSSVPSQLLRALEGTARLLVRTEHSLTHKLPSVLTMKSEGQS